MGSQVGTFHAQLPVKLSFGDGVIGELAPTLTGLGAATALAVLEGPVADHPQLRAALDAAEAAGVAVDVVVKDPGEPTFALADELADRVRRRGHDAVVGVGGGSALDVAKAARILADNGGRARDYAAGERAPRMPRLPLVLCPTTAGTGSEVSGASVLTDAEADRKTGFGAPEMRAQHALVDPVLTHRLPPAPTAHAGIDAIAQAIGACTVAHATPLSTAFGLEACRLVAGGLAAAVRDGSDAHARRRVACGSLTAGLAMNLADCGADHALAQAIGALHKLPHGLTVGLVVAETLDVSRADCAATLERVADALGEPAGGPADGSRAVRALRRLLREVGFPTLREAGIGEQDLPALVAEACGEQGFFLGWDAHDWTAADVERAYRAGLALDAR